MKGKTDTDPELPTPNERYRAIETGGDEILVYDRQNTAAWLQSDYTVELEP